MALTGENFKRFNRKREIPVRVSKVEELRIRNEIKALQEERALNYANDLISDTELEELERVISNRIGRLIESLF